MLTKTQVEKIQKKSSSKDNALSTTFNALSDPGRLQILKILLEYRDKDICVSDIANILGVSVPAASRQLKILELSELIEKIRHGQTTCFRVKGDNQISKLIIDVLKRVEA